MSQQKRQSSPEKRNGRGAGKDSDTSEPDAERTCGACGHPIQGQAQFSRWGPVHPNCRRRVPGS